MTEYLKLIIIAQVAIAILILPSSAFAVCNCSREDPDGGNFSSPYEDQICDEYCISLGKSDFTGLNGCDKYGTGPENRSVPYCFLPVAYDSNVTISENTPMEITLHATNTDGDTMTYRISSGPSDGTLGTITGNKVVYTPYVNYTGIDSFSFRAIDENWGSNTATVTITVEPKCSAQLSHVFYGNVTIDGEPAPENTIISAVGPGFQSNITGNPVTTQKDGFYGSPDLTTQNLVVQGCIDDGAHIAFYADGVRAEVYDVNTSGPWQTTYPFKAGEVTNLNIRVPDEVYINAIRATISNSTYGFYTAIEIVKNPWMELRVTPGMFDIQISAEGVHRFSDLPELHRGATLGIYENGNPLSSEKNVWLGSKIVSYAYIANETRTFDILIYVNERPEINDVKHITIYTCSGSDCDNITTTQSPGARIFPGGQVSVDAGADQRFNITPFYGYQTLI